MERPKVFISHIAEESYLAQILQRHIRGDFLGLVEVFVSSDDKSIRAGSKWLEDIDKALRTAQVELILCSKESVKRPWINFEAGAGWVKGIPIVPICHSGFRKTDLPVPLNMLKAIEANEENGLKNLYDLIAHQLGVTTPNIDFKIIRREVKHFEDNYETKSGIKNIEQENQSEIPALMTQIVRFIDHLRAENKLIEVIEKASIKGTFDNPFQEKVATWRIMMTREQVERIQKRKWELQAMTPSAYVAYIFESIMVLLGDEDEYWTVTNLPFWSNKAVGESAFLTKNIEAAQRGVSIRRVFIIDKEEWNRAPRDKHLETILQEHKLACEKVNSINPGKMTVRCYLSENINRDRLVYRHFGLARHKKNEEEDDGCMVIVPLYESIIPGSAISHLKCIFSNGSSSDVETVEFVKKFWQVFSISEDISSIV